MSANGLAASIRGRAARWREDSLVRNSSYVMATTIVSSALGFAWWTIAARVFPVEDVGLATALTSAMIFVALLTNLGVGTIYVERLPHRGEGRPWSQTVNAGLAIVAVTGLAGGLIAVLVLPALSSEMHAPARDPAFAALFVVGVAVWSASVLLDFVFVAERAAGHMLLRNAAFGLVRLPVLALPLLADFDGARVLFGAWVGATLLSVGFSVAVQLPLVHRSYRAWPMGLGGEARQIMRSTTWHHLISMGGQVPVYLLPVLVTARLSAEDNAYFYVTWMACGIFYLVSPAVAASLFAEGSHERDGLDRKVAASVKLIATLQIPPGVVFLFGGGLVLSAFGPDYADEGGTLLFLLLAAALPDAVTNVWVSAVRVRGRLRSAAILNISMAVTCMVAAWFLLPEFGIAGAGLAWLGAQTGGALAVLVDVLIGRRRARHTPLGAQEIGPAAEAVPTAAAPLVHRH